MRCSIRWIASFYINHWPLEWPRSSCYNPAFGTLNIIISFLVVHTEKHLEHAASFDWWNGIFCCSSEHVFMDISTWSQCSLALIPCMLTIMNESGALIFMFTDFQFWGTFLPYLCTCSHVHGGCWICNCLILWIPVFWSDLCEYTGIFHDLNSVLNLNVFLIDIVNLSLIPHGYKLLPLFVLWLPC